ncbi:conserved hypothetical protein [Burkholderiales bacterium]|nr:conserved hypothetical protein [Burkholderiales bacterium]
MTRLLFWCLIGLLFYLGLRKLGRGGSLGSARPAGGNPAEDMVRCAACGLNLPKSEALPLNGQWACCAEHARERQPAVRP